MSHTTFSPNNRPFSLPLYACSQTSTLRYDSIFPTTSKIDEYLKQADIKNPGGKSPFEYALGESLWSWVASDTQGQTEMADYIARRRKGGVR
jgi:hypothetical protein